MLKLRFCCQYHVTVVRKKELQAQADPDRLRFRDTVLTIKKSQIRAQFKSTSKVGSVTLQLLKTTSIWIRGEWGGRTERRVGGAGKLLFKINQKVLRSTSFKLLHQMKLNKSCDYF
jgi:hypothetical protein